MESRLFVILEDKGHAIYTIAPSASAQACAARMQELGVGSLLVIENDRLVGIVGERDLIRKIICENLDVIATTVADIMTTEIIVVSPGMTVTEAMQIITENRVRHLPVIENGRIVGLISIGDLTRWAMLAQKQEISSLTEYIVGR